MTGTTTDHRHDLAELLSNAEVATWTATTLESERVERPTSVQEAEFRGDLGFSVDGHSAEVTQIEVHHPSASTKNDSP